ncbi:MAG: type III secretion system chaperone [Bordetella sp.]|uniref:type III secretion system chaperone n=1 Tax=Bordetella sp. TaxID=28081 RepID=UPI003F7B70DB
MSNSNAAMLIAALGKAVGITPLTLDADGALALQVGDDKHLNFQHDGKTDHFTLFMPLGQVRAGDDLDAVYADMLRANRFWRGTLGATLSLDDQTPPGAVLAVRLSCAGLSEEDFIAAVERMLDAAREWLSHLAGTGETRQAPARADDSHRALMFRV